MALLHLAPIAPHAGSIFINEFHYDNVGTDVNEAIEVVMPLGVDPSTLSLYLYNGANGLQYYSTALPPATPVAGNGE